MEGNTECGNTKGVCLREIDTSGDESNQTNRTGWRNLSTITRPSVDEAG